jgi:hypothetical protein
LIAVEPAQRLRALIGERDPVFVRCRACERVRPLDVMEIAAKLSLDVRLEGLAEQLLCACGQRQADVMIRVCDLPRFGGLPMQRRMGRKSRR